MIGIDTSILVACEMQSHERFSAALDAMQREGGQGAPFALSTSVLAEFIHVVTDARRFNPPMPMEIGLRQAEMWCSANDVILLSPNQDACDLFFHWMTSLKLGRKRILDTMLAATYAVAGVKKIATLNPADFRIFNTFEFVDIQL